MRRLWSLCLFFLFPAAFAFADMIPEMPPQNCAPGSVDSQSHEGSYCRPLDCTSDAQCGKELVCQSQALCIYTTTYYARPDGREAKRSSAAGACSKEKACTVGACETAKRCVPKAGASAKPPEITPDNPPKVTPESQPEGTPDSQPEATPQTPPTKVAPSGRCSVEAASGTMTEALLGLSFLLMLGYRRRAKSRR